MGSRGYYHGYRNPVLDQLGRMGNTVERGMARQGNVPFDIANLNMDRAKLEADIENTAAEMGIRKDQLAEMIRAHKATEGHSADVLAESTRAHKASESISGGHLAETRLNNQQTRSLNEPAVAAAKGHMDRRDRDLTLPDLSDGNIHRMGHWLSTGKRDGDQETMLDEFAGEFGAKYMTQGKNKGFFVRKDGTRLKVGEIDDNPERVQGIILGNTDVDRAAQDIKEQIEYEYENGLVLPEFEGLYQDKLKRIEKFQKDPTARIAAMERGAVKPG